MAFRLTSGAGGWGDPVGSWTYAGAVANVTFTGLGAYRELWVVFYDLQHASAGSEYPILRTSTDNGATFTSSAGAYKVANSTVDTAVALYSANASASVIAGDIALQAFKDAAERTYIRSVIGTVGTSLQTNRTGTRAVAESNNAIRFAFSAGANFAAGSIRVYGRR